jgi:uncharacterized protein
VVRPALEERLGGAAEVSAGDGGASGEGAAGMGASGMSAAGVSASGGVAEAGDGDAGAAGASPEPATENDLAVVAAQLGRPPRGTRAIAHRCPCGLPDVVQTVSRLADGTPFPTLFYLTCPRAVAACSRLESAGVMKGMAARLAAEPDLALRYRRAHEDYLARREALGHVPEIVGVSAGGMPDRVKCLHVQLAHALAVGPGVNPLGDETRRLAGPWWAGGPCVPPA